jgi:pyruvate/2-oxoglutarate dehydrogenase complex dihydrolipoamide acyltransferase (E2) component
VAGTGPNSRIIAADVRDAIAARARVGAVEKPAAAAAAGGSYEDVPLSQMRKVWKLAFI